MKKPPEQASIRNIIHAAKLAQSFLEGASNESFQKDLLRQAAICRQLEIIGEAATRLPAEFRKSLPDVPCNRNLQLK